MTLKELKQTIAHIVNEESPYVIGGCFLDKKDKLQPVFNELITALEEAQTTILYLTLCGYINNHHVSDWLTKYAHLFEQEKK